MSVLSDEINQRIRTTSKIHQKMIVRSLVDIYRDRWLHIIEDELSRQFSPKEYQKLYWLRTQELNLLKRVVNELSLVYKEPAQRSLYFELNEKEEQESTETIKANDLYSDITCGVKKDVILKQVNRYTNLTNHTVLKVGYAKGKLDYEILLFDNVEVYTDQNDWTKIIAVKYYTGLELPVDYSIYSTANPAKKENRSSSDRVEHAALMTQEYNKAIIWVSSDMPSKGLIENAGIESLQAGKVYYVECQGNSEHITEVRDNPYIDEHGDYVLPFVFFDKNYPIDCRFDFSSGNDLRDLTVNAAIMLIHLNELLKYQSYKTLVLTVQDRNKLPPEGLEIGPTSAIVLESGIEGGNASASVLDLQSNINGLLDFIQKRIYMVLAGYGVSPENFSMSGQAQSGLALQISNMGKLEARQDQIDMYRMAEEQLFEIERIVYNTNALNEGRELLDVKLDFRADFSEPSFPIDRAQEAAWLTFLKQNNAITDLDIIKKENPDLDDDAAMAKFIKNKAINQKQSVTLQPLETPILKNVSDK